MSDQAVAIPQRHLHVFARDPAEMEKAQRDLILWIGSKIERVFDELREARENLAIAKQNKWRQSGWQGRVSKAKGNIRFYQKVREALKAGYYIIPDFPVDVFAIRTTAEWGKGERRGREGGWSTYNDFRQAAEKLDEGKGEYRSADAPAEWDSDYTKTETDGRSTPMSITVAGPMQPVDFPFKLVKPETMTATAKAMALKVFDEIGALPQPRRKGDPIIVGRVLRPAAYGPSLTFFIAWWLNTEEI